MNYTVSHKHYNYIFFALLLLIVIDRISHLSLFSFQFADGDQTILWVGAIEMLQGNFHEPSFYGQSYNTMLEAFLAIPLLALGIPVYKALPIITSLLAVFPFILFAFLAKREGNKIGSILFLAIPLLLPEEYMLLTIMPRGFVAGVFSASIAATILLANKENTKLQFLLAGFFGGLTLVLNPNGTLLLLPVYLYTFIKTNKKISMVVLMLLGVIPSILWYAYISWFYAQHPTYIVHSSNFKAVSIDSFVKAIMHFHEMFYGLFPFIIFAGAAIIPTLLFIAYRLNKKGEKTFALSLATTVVFIFITFFFSKISDGTGSVFFAYSRMFLALPVVAGIGLYFLFKDVEIKTKPMLWFLAITLIIVIAKLANINGRVEWNLYKNTRFVEVFKIEELKQEYKDIQNMADSLNTELLIINEKDDVLNYGVMALSNNRLKTVSLSYERKGWLVEQIKTNVYTQKPFLLWCEDEALLKTQGLKAERLSEQYPIYKASTPVNPLIFMEQAKESVKNN